MADATTHLTVTELADRLGVSDTTIRNWRRAYGDLIPETVGADGVRRYPLAQFEVVAVLRERNLPPEEIRRALAGVAERAPDPTPDEWLVLFRRLVEAVERIADRMERPDGA